jgi:hypothetical protein
MAPLSSETKGGPLANGNSVQAAVNSWVCGQGSCCSARTHSHPPERSSTPIAAATFNHIAYRKDSVEPLGFGIQESLDEGHEAGEAAPCLSV